jgi:hypothetical protein
MFRKEPSLIIKGIKKTIFFILKILKKSGMFRKGHLLIITGIKMTI